MTKDPFQKVSQSDVSAKKNASFFADHFASYARNIEALDTYVYIRSCIDESVNGADLLLDIGNGGVFDYETNAVNRIIALDLFLDSLPPEYRCPKNVTLQTGSALAIPFSKESFDTVLMVMLLHHLVGSTVVESIKNVRFAMAEAYRVLKPGGKIIIIESCIPQWFFQFERLVFPVVSSIIHAAIEHPATVQYPASLIKELIAKETGSAAEVTKIPMGNWVLQFGCKVPALLTPVTPFRFIVHKPHLPAIM